MSMCISFYDTVYDHKGMLADIPDYVEDIGSDGHVLTAIVNSKYEGNILIWCQKHFKPTEERDCFLVPTRDVIFTFETEDEKNEILNNRQTIVGAGKSWTFFEEDNRIVFQMPY